MKKTALFTLIIFLFSFVPCVAETEEAFFENEILIMYKNGDTEVKTFSNNEEMEKAVKDYSDMENVDFVQPNFIYQTTGYITNDPYIANQWALDNDGTFFVEESKNRFPVFEDPFDFWGFPDDYYWHAQKRNTKSLKAVAGVDINITKAWEKYSSGGKGVVVAIIDTGIDRNHPDLYGKTWINEDEIPFNGIDDDNNGYRDDVFGWNFYGNNNSTFLGSEDDHGTHSAGTIVAKTNKEGISGMVREGNVKVMSVKALGGKNGSGSTQSLIDAIKYAEDNGASICNLSLGTEKNDKAIYKTIANSDMLFVISSGNEGENSDIKPVYPAAYDLDNIISVTNISYDGNVGKSSNYGKTSVDIAAPGTSILSTTPSNGYTYMSGTSMAAPFVSGAAAMVYSYFGDKVKLWDVKEIILSTAKKTDILKNLVLSGGMLDVGKALSFNLSNLSGKKWQKKGSAPEISAEQTSGNRRVAVYVNDSDGDLKKILYAYGIKAESYFDVGNIEGKVYSAEKITYINLPSAGTYTLCAVDKCGNKSVCTVNVSDYGYNIGSDRDVLDKLYMELFYVGD